MKKKYTVIWKYYNDMWVLKYECRSTDDIGTARKNYEDYQSNWKYISVWVEIDWKRANSIELYKE